MATSTDRVRRFRERQRASIEAADPPVLRDADELLVPAVRETIAALELGPEFASAAAVALRYAQVIDDARDQAYALRWLGPELLRSLESLGGTPRARASMKPAGKADAGRRPNQLARLRAEHGQRMAHRTGL